LPNRTHRGWLVAVAGLSFLSLATVPVAVGAQDVGSIHRTPPPVARAARREGPISIDGRLDEAAWTAATPITTFTQIQPTEGAPATQRTEVRVLYDAGAIYIGARMYDTLGRHGVRARLVRRDQQLDLDNSGPAPLTSDKLTIILDPYHDHLTRAVFEVNPSGVKGDALGAGGSNLDTSWDPVWDEATQIDSLGWTAEIRIPLSQLRFARRDSVQTWGMQVMRTVDRLNERDWWAFSHRNENNGPATYGHLTGLALGRPPRQFEILPYVSNSTEGYAANAGNPLVPIYQDHVEAGADVKYLLTSNITLDATINPDFGQVDLDPAVINLTAFETFFPEKRPFFISGSGAFDFGGFNCIFCSNVSSLSLFYSRRIGRSPQLGDYYSSIAAYTNIPTNTNILGAAKLTGRTQSGYTIGVLDAVTNQENGSYTVDVDSARHTVPMEPLSNYMVARVKRDFRDGATVVGGIVTSTVRNLDSRILADSLHRDAEAVGGDFITSWDNRHYSLMGSVALSDVGGTPKSILLTEESSAHYFQRPDRRSVGGGLFDDRFDSSATSLRGYGAYLRLGKDNGDWLWETATNIRSPGFEVNDLSFMGRADYVWTNVNLAHQWTVPSTWYRNLFADIGGQTQHTFGGDRTDLQGQASLGGQFNNYWQFNSYYIYKPTVMDDDLTRGGPVVKRHGYQDIGLGLNTDPRKVFVLQSFTEGNVGVNEPGQSLFSQVIALLKPISNVSVSLGPSLTLVRRGLQYDSAFVGQDVPLFFGTRYVFASIDQTTFSMDTRLSVAFTPTLTLDLYAQPFLASGHYYGFEQFDHPRQLHKSVYGRDVGSIQKLTDGSGYCIDPVGNTARAAACPTSAIQDFVLPDPDFNARSLRGNAVLRWEYRPGATIYFVWQQTRFDDTSYGNFQTSRDQSLLLRAPSDNVFLIKVNYWLPL
jgi:Domain of unknown function (DUF5916)/Carbohydrate family 9 binding domain-like